MKTELQNPNQEPETQQTEIVTDAVEMALYQAEIQSYNYL
jgi:hypothetical protein